MLHGLRGRRSECASSETHARRNHGESRGTRAAKCVVMHPFKTSITARMILSACALLFVGGGAIPLLHLDPDIAPPMLFVACGLLSLVGLILGAFDHSPIVALLAALLPLLFWPMTMVVMYVARHANYGWILIALGIVPIATIVRLIRALRSEEHTSE